MSSHHTLTCVRDTVVQMKSACTDLSSSKDQLCSDNLSELLQACGQIQAELEPFLASEDHWSMISSRQARHNFRNRISVIRGFAELMSLDVEEGAASDALQHLVGLSDQFKDCLEAVTKDGGEDETLIC